MHSRSLRECNEEGVEANRARISENPDFTVQIGPVQCAYRTCPVWMWQHASLWDKRWKPYQTVSKNYEILTVASQHLEEATHQILDQNSKVWRPDQSDINTRQCGMREVLLNFSRKIRWGFKSTPVDLKLCRGFLGVLRGYLQSINAQNSNKLKRSQKQSPERVFS